MSDKELSEVIADGIELVQEMGSEFRLNKQKRLASESLARLDKLVSIQRECLACPLTETDFMAWTAATETIETYKYGLSSDDLLDVGMSLAQTATVGLKMAGIQTAVKEIQGQLTGASASSLNFFKAIMGKKLDEDASELVQAEKQVAVFGEGMQNIFEPVVGLAKIQAQDEVFSAINRAKRSCAARELDSWLTRKNHKFAETLRVESEYLMSEGIVHPDIDAAVAEICNCQDQDESGEPIYSFAFTESACLFTFGMAKEMSDRSELGLLEEEHSWPLVLAVASAAASLIRHGITPSAVSYYLRYFYRGVYMADEFRRNGNEQIWIQAGVASMDRLCRSHTNQLAEDFRRNRLLLDIGNV